MIHRKYTYAISFGRLLIPFSHRVIPLSNLSQCSLIPKQKSRQWGYAALAAFLVATISFGASFYSVPWKALSGTDFSLGFGPASVEAIQQAGSDSNCARRLLESANRNAQIIRGRDIDNVKALCATVDLQEGAFIDPTSTKRG